MKFNQLQALEKWIKSEVGNSTNKEVKKGKPPVFIVSSNEDFTRRAAAASIKNFLIDGEGGSSSKKKQPQPNQERVFCVKYFEAKSLEIEELKRELETLPFLVPSIVIEIQNSERLSTELIKLIQAYSKRPNPNVYLLLLASSLSTATKWFKELESLGVALVVTAQKAWEKEKSLLEWLGKYVESKKKRIQQPAKEALVQFTGQDQECLCNEVDKLFCYIGERKEIRLEDVNAVCCRVNSETGFQLVEAIYQKNAALGLQIAHALLSDESLFIGLLRLLRKQMQTLLEIGTILLSGGSQQQITDRFAYMKGRVLQKNMQYVKYYGLQSLKKGIPLIDQTETLVKNSDLSPKFLMERLILQLVS